MAAGVWGANVWQRRKVATITGAQSKIGPLAVRMPLAGGVGWHGRETVPQRLAAGWGGTVGRPCHNEGLRVRMPLAGGVGWHGRETVPQRGDRATTGWHGREIVPQRGPLYFLVRGRRAFPHAEGNSRLF